MNCRGAAREAGLDHALIASSRWRHCFLRRDEGIAPYIPALVNSGLSALAGGDGEKRPPAGYLFCSCKKDTEKEQATGSELPVAIPMPSGEATTLKAPFGIPTLSHGFFFTENCPGMDLTRPYFRSAASSVRLSGAVWVPAVDTWTVGKNVRRQW